MIDPSGLVAFGNMGSGGGLAAVFSPDTSTGYATVPTGWAGLTLSEPTRLKSVSITSASNGFDASGSTTQITIRIYGRTGAAPAGPSDWTMLASTTFTDVNAVTTKTLVSADQITPFDHIGFSISTGVWAIAQYVQFEEATEATAMLPTPDLAKRTVYQHRIDTEILLPWTAAELQATRWKPIEIPAPCIGLLDITVDFKHRGIPTDGEPNGYTGPIGIGWSFGRRFGATLAAMIAAPWQRYDDFTLSTQIASMEHHYATATRSGVIDLDPGFYQFSVVGTSHTTAGSSNGHASTLVEYGKGLNGARLIVSTDTIHRV